jgi:hypothetical protein
MSAPDTPLVELPGNRSARSVKFLATAGPVRKASINGISTRPRIFTEYLSLGVDDLAFGIEDFSRGF